MSGLKRRQSFLERLSEGNSAIKRRLSRKGSFLESKPIKTLAKLTRRASFSTSLSQRSSSLNQLNSKYTYNYDRDWYWHQKEIEDRLFNLCETMAPPPLLSQQQNTNDADFYPVHLPDDVPVDFLEGRMELIVVLPSQKHVRMSVERRTPMMDLLVQITSAHRINPGGHVIQVMNDRSDDFLYYKPSTPIGALDTTKIHVVPKHSINESAMRKAPMKILNLPFEATFRLQVRLPRHQLYVCRISPKTRIEHILQQVCREKGLDPRKYEVRKTDHTEETLSLSACISDYGINEVAVVHIGKATNRSVSTSDIIRLQEIEQRRNQILGIRAQSSAGDSISSGSGCATPSRPTSPTMSTVTGMTNRSNKKRRAPAPPGPSKVQTSKSITSLVDERRRNDVVDNHQLSISNSKSMSMSNLKNIDRNLNRSNASVISNTGSVTSINSVGKKRRAPVPPAIKKVPEPISEETPSMIHLENNNNVTKPHRLEEIGRRVLPDLPVPKSKQNLVRPAASRNIELDIVVPKPAPPAKDNPPPYTESAVEQPSDRPAPAPRSSLLEEAKIDVEMSSKKKSAKKLKNKVVPNNPVPLDPPVTPPQVEEVPILQETLTDRSKIERALSPDSALASSESSGSSLHRKNHNSNNQGGDSTTHNNLKTTVPSPSDADDQVVLRPKAAPSKPPRTYASLDLDTASRIEQEIDVQKSQRHTIQEKSQFSPDAKHIQDDQYDEHRVLTKSKKKSKKSSKKKAESPVYATVEKKSKSKKKLSKSQSETAEESIYEELDDVKNEVKDLVESIGEPVIMLRPLSIIGTPEASEESVKEIDVLKPEPKKDEFMDTSDKKNPLEIEDVNVLENPLDTGKKIADDEIEVTEKVKKKKSKKKTKSEPEDSGTKTKKKRKKTKDVKQISNVNELDVTGLKTEDIPDPELKANENKPELLDSSVTAEKPISQLSDLKDEQTKVEDPDKKTLEVKSEIPQPIPRSSIAKETEIVQENPKVDDPDQLKKPQKLSVENILMEQKEPKQQKPTKPQPEQTQILEPKQEFKGNSEETKLQNQPKIELESLPKVKLNKELKGRSAETSRNPLARKPITKIDPTSLIKSADDLPNFRMAPVSTAKVPGIQKPEQNSSNNFSHQNSKIEDDEDIKIDLRLFAKPSKPQKPKIPQGLTKDEERILEQAEKNKLENEQRLKEAEQEKSQKLNELRIQRKSEENARLAKTRELKIEKDLKAKAQKLTENAPPKTTEDLRAQLKQMTANSILNRKVVDDLVIEEDDDLLPIKRKNKTSTSSLSSDTSTSSSNDQGLVKAAAESLLPNKDKDEVRSISSLDDHSEEGSSSTDLKHEQDDEKEENSLNHRQAISTALDESFATVLDFGPEEFSSSSEDEKQQSDHHDNTVRNLNSANIKENVDAEEPKVNLAPDVIPRENVPIFVSNEEKPILTTTDLTPKVRAKESQDFDQVLTPDSTPKIRARLVQDFEPDLTPKVRSKVIPDSEQDLAQKVTPYLTPNVRETTSPDLTPKVTSKVIPDLEQENAPKVTPNVIQNSAPAKVTVATVSNGSIPDLNQILDSKEIEIIERVTSVDESVTPLLDEPTDWSMRTIPDPPSGFKDSIVIPEPEQYQNSTMIPESPEIRMPSGLPTILGPMKFSIDSYNDRTVKEEPYVVKLSRTESMRDELAPVFAKEKTAPTISKAESFSLARFNGESTISESRPLPPPKPQLPKEKEEEIPPAAAISSINSNSNATSKIQHRPKLNVKMERAKTFVGSNVHKTSLKSDRILPNDDLVLNQARRQKSFAASNSGPAAKKINQLKNSAENKVNLQRASSMGHLEKPEEKIVRVRSLVEVDDYDEAASPQVQRKSSTIEQTLKAIRQEFVVASNSERPGNKKDEDLKPITPIISEEANSDTSKQRSNDEPKAEKEDMMHHHNHHQRFYQYAGPPSIVMGTWGDRSGVVGPSRSHFAPPPPPFAIPPAGVPGGRLGPAPNSRMNTGYHSLQYTPNPPPEFRGNGLEKKNSSASATKYSSSKKAATPAKAAVDHGSDQLHKLPQVKAFVNQVEQSAKHQLKSSKNPEKWATDKSATLDAKPRKSSSSGSSSTINNNNRKNSAKMEIAEIKNSTKIPNGNNQNPVLPDEPSKPQFYFGQSMSEVVKKSSVSNGHQTAIDKVKKNEALTHPKRAEMEQKLKITELSKKGRHTSIITVSDDQEQNTQISPPQNGQILLKKANSQKASSMSSGVSSLSSSSSNSSTRSSPAKETSQIVPKKPVQEPTQDSIRKAFEAQLIAGKSRLKKTPAGAPEMEVGHVAKLPPAPIPPPPPPPSEEALKSGALRSYEIPQAPKLKKTAPAIASKKGLVAPNGLSARDELMNAIRGTGGFQGLRKINSGKNL